MFEVVAVGLAVLAITTIAHDGETHWMEVVLGFYFLPVK